MRGLPPPPDDVALVRLGFDIDGTFASVGWWVFVPGGFPSGVLDVDNIIDYTILNVLGHCLELMHVGATCTTCRCSTFGASTTYDLVRSPGPNAGAWTGGQAAQVALGLYWLTGEGGKRGHSITHLPAFPDVFTDDHASINQLAVGNALASGSEIRDAFNAMPAPSGGSCLMGTLERSRAGVPLGASVFVPFIGLNVTSKVCTIRRRISPRGIVTPS